MINAKLEQQLTGPEHWPHGTSITIPGDPNAEALLPELSQSEKEAIIQNWSTVAVIGVGTRPEVRIGFISLSGNFQLLASPAATDDGKLGVRVGPETVQLLVMPAQQGDSIPDAQLVETAQDTDPRYDSLPVY